MERQEVMINARDLAYSIIKKWRALIVAACIGCAAVVGYQFVPKSTVSVENEADTKEPDEQKQSVEQQITEKKQQIIVNTQKLETNEESIQRKEESIDEREQALKTAEELMEKYQEVLDLAEEALETALPQAQGEIILAMTGANDGIRDLQSKSTIMQQEITTLQQEIAALRKEIEDTIPQENERLNLEIEELEKSAADEEAKQDTLTQTSGQGKISAGSLLTAALIGMCSGIILTAGYLFVRYCLERKLHDARTLRMRYQYFILGSLYTPSGKSGKLDRLFANWAGYNFEIDEEKIYGMIAANILVQKEKPQTIVLTGTVSEESLKRVYSGIAGQFEKGEILFQVQPYTAYYSSEEILRIKNSSVIIVEAKDQSMLSEMDRQADLFEAANTKVIGAILV